MMARLVMGHCGPALLVLLFRQAEFYQSDGSR